ncbi:hypothetical protein NEOLEDRAFT_743942 [Neolentinus lepideus HHB14362 ss-1]|uniref:Uncharacterized protein n=1 Tax=Neolentinus lepideus HHB14362 ss-1 TaxID=1314782 RepID=A0A165PX65_9AGAM|nr:hypothetical protein NEOLEDRAFT_743942 [Neolentinus lepideus HHB14362 ss-1]
MSWISRARSPSGLIIPWFSGFRVLQWVGSGLISCVLNYGMSAAVVLLSLFFVVYSVHTLCRRSLFPTPLQPQFHAPHTKTSRKRSLLSSSLYVPVLASPSSSLYFYFAFGLCPRSFGLAIGRLSYQSNNLKKSPVCFWSRPPALSLVSRKWSVSTLCLLPIVLCLRSSFCCLSHVSCHIDSTSCIWSSKWSSSDLRPPALVVLCCAQVLR